MTKPRRWTVPYVKTLATQPGEHFDPQVRGLALRVRESGAASWIMLYRLHGVLRRWTIGAFDDLSLKDARDQADDGRGRIAKGEDPAGDRRAARRAAVAARAAAARAQRDSVEALAHAYIEQHAKPKKRTWRDDQSKLNTEILKAWKGRPVSSITRRDCRTLVQGIADRGAPIYANRVAALLSRLFRFAVDEELIETNIAAQLPKPGTEVGQRPEAEQEDKPYDEEEIRAIWQATESLDATPRALYRLGLLTGQRPGEISGMAWTELEWHWWTIPASRTKNRKEHRVYLTALALEALKAVPRVSQDPATQDDQDDTPGGARKPAVPRVFLGYRGKRQIAQLNLQVFTGVRRRKKPRHALRDTVATGMAAAGVSVEDVSHVLNHSVGLRVTAGYNAYAYDKEKRLSLLKWERRLRAILDGSAGKRNVVVSMGPRP